MRKNQKKKKNLSVLRDSGRGLVLGHALRLLEHKVAEPSHRGLLGGLDGGRVLEAGVLLELVADGLAELVAVASLFWSFWSFSRLRLSFSSTREEQAVAAAVFFF